MAALLLSCVICFLVGMVLYGVLLWRLRRPVSYFDLRGLHGPHARLALWTWRLWTAAVLLSLVFAAQMLVMRR